MAICNVVNEASYLETLEHIRDDESVGHKAERLLDKVLNERFGLKRVDPEEYDKGTRFEEFVYFRTNVKQDIDDQIGDFGFYDVKNHKWILVDLSVSIDPKVHSEKRWREEHGGPRFLSLSLDSIKLAALGNIPKINEIGKQLNIVLS